jgi:hypothetical protein
MPSRHVRRMRRAIGGTSERQLSKEQVLGLYLTLAPLGGNLEGVRAASLAYFREKIDVAVVLGWRTRRRQSAWGPSQMLIHSPPPPSLPPPSLPPSLPPPSLPGMTYLLNEFSYLASLL